MPRSIDLSLDDLLCDSVISDARLRHLRRHDRSRRIRWLLHIAAAAVAERWPHQPTTWRDIIQPTRRHHRRARHLAAYIVITISGVGMREVARAIGLDHAAISRGCAQIEDSRDDPATDRWINQIERAYASAARSLSTQIRREPAHLRSRRYAITEQDDDIPPPPREIQPRHRRTAQ